MFFKNIKVHMDYSGQKSAERIFQVIIVIFAVVGFLVGYVSQQLMHTMGILATGCLIAALITLPPWPVYRKDPIHWQKPVKNEETQTEKPTQHSKKRR